MMWIVIFTEKTCWESVLTKDHYVFYRKVYENNWETKDLDALTRRMKKCCMLKYYLDE